MSLVILDGLLPIVEHVLPSNDFRDFLKNNNIGHVLNATCSPKSNGQQVERMDCKLIPMFAKLVDGSAHKWDRFF